MIESKNDAGTMLWDWMTSYPDGSVGRVGVYLPGVGNTSLSTRIESIARGHFKDIAESHRASTGQRVWLRKWIKFEDEQDLP